MSLLTDLLSKIFRNQTAASSRLSAILDDLAAKSSEKLDWRDSIVDLMKIIGMDSDRADREKLAKELGFTGDLSDSAMMNIFLQNRIFSKIVQNHAVDVVAILDDLAAKSPEELDWRDSIVDLMKIIGADGSRADRERLAEELGFTDDLSDSAKMNMFLHTRLLIKIVDNRDKIPRVRRISWDLTGNSGTIPTTNFLGTSDNQPLIIKTNNREAMRINADGVVTVAQEIRLTNADCAEDFDIANADLLEPGTVMVLGDEGSLHQSRKPYDKRVAGVISGAAGYKPGIVLDKRQSKNNRQPVALLGKVYCKVDTRYAPVEVGDLLTTSSTPGHAMKASDRRQAFGAVIGKALRPFSSGQGLIPILIALQ
jgi:hypothetical protein